MSAANEDPIKAIQNSPLKDVLVRGFAELYKQRPDFPIEFLGKWLKNYSQGQQRKNQLEQTRGEKENRVAQLQRNIQLRAKKADEEKAQFESKIKNSETEFNSKLNSTSYLVDLLGQYLPEQIQKSCRQRNVDITGCYIGELKYRHKKLEEHSFEPGAQFDTENPKVIEYVGASKNQRFMVGQILSNQIGRSYEVFKEEDPPAEEAQEGKPVKIKKKYLYVPQVQRDQKIYFFKYPKLGSFACFPLRVKSCLSTTTFDKGISDYKAFVKNKQEVEKEYSEKYNEGKASYEESKRKYEEHQGNEEDPQFQADHASLLEQFKKNEQTFREIEGAPPVIQPFKYETKLKDYVVGVDTMGFDSQIPQQVLTFLDNKVDNFRQSWEQKEYKMLLDDILQYIQQELTLENLDNYFKDQEKGIISTYQSQIKEQFVNRQKQAEFQLTLIKVSKLIKILSQTMYINSLNAYLNYNLPKYTEIVQIVLMLLGYKKAQINLPRSNTLNYRKYIQKKHIQKMLGELQKYELKRESSDVVENQYKINKLLQRLQKIDGEAVSKYNGWLFALLFIAKQLCWARIQCRDAKIEAFEARTKAKNDRDAEIVKYDEQIEKALEAAKAQLNEQTLPTFSEQQWRKTYAVENVRPQPLQVDELKTFLDLE